MKCVLSVNMNDIIQYTDIKNNSYFNHCIKDLFIDTFGTDLNKMMRIVNK